MQIAPFGYSHYASCQRQPALRSTRATTNDVLIPKIQDIWQANMQAFGSDETQHNMKRETVKVARRMVGWRVSSSMRSDSVLDALDQALYDRQPDHNALIHHSDRDSQCVSIRYAECLARAGIEPSVGRRGDSYDNALAETINELYKTELIYRRSPRKTKESLELATLEWVSWFNHHRLLEPIGYIPPVEAEANHFRQLAEKTETTVLL